MVIGWKGIQDFPGPKHRGRKAYGPLYIINVDLEPRRHRRSKWRQSQTTEGLEARIRH